MGETLLDVETRAFQERRLLGHVGGRRVFALLDAEAHGAEAEEVEYGDANVDPEHVRELVRHDVDVQQERRDRADRPEQADKAPHAGCGHDIREQVPVDVLHELIEEGEDHHEQADRQHADRQGRHARRRTDVDFHPGDDLVRKAKGRRAQTKQRHGEQHERDATAPAAAVAVRLETQRRPDGDGNDLRDDTEQDVHLEVADVIVVLEVKAEDAGSAHSLENREAEIAPEQPAEEHEQPGLGVPQRSAAVLLVHRSGRRSGMGGGRHVDGRSHA